MNQPNSRPLSDDLTLDQAVKSQSNYLSKEDVDPPVLAQIAYLTEDDVEDNNAMKKKTVLHFHGEIKPLIMNLVNKELLKSITGAQTLGQLKNQYIVLYNDPSIMFQGRMTGGIRIRSAQQPAMANQPMAPVSPTNAPQAPAAPTTDVPFDDDIPY